MLITKNVEIKATGSLIKKYNTKYHEMILIPIEELSIGSHALVECLCDYCGDILIMEYRSFLKRSKIINKTCCKKCSPIKQKEINLLLYGVENVFELNSIKEKIKQTCLEKYGVERMFSLKLGKNSKDDMKIVSCNSIRSGEDERKWKSLEKG